MRTSLFLALALAGCATSLTHAPMDSSRSLAAAESAFAAHSVREGMRAAFIANFAADGVFVREGWVNARKSLEPRPNPPIVLDWRPVYAEAAASGEIGLSTGPWKITVPDKPEAAPRFGQFVSIWRREGQGPWRVEVDLGISHPQATLWNEALEAVAASTRERAPPQGIKAAEERFARAVRTQGLAQAYARYASDRIRFYRDGAPPALGKSAALAALGSSGRGFVHVVERAERADSGEFGYARGWFADPQAPDKPAGYFLHVWRIEDGDWRIALDVTNPAGK